MKVTSELDNVVTHIRWLCWHSYSKPLAQILRMPTHNKNKCPLDILLLKLYHLYVTRGGVKRNLIYHTLTQKVCVTRNVQRPVFDTVSWSMKKVSHGQLLLLSAQNLASTQRRNFNFDLPCCMRITLTDVIRKWALKSTAKNPWAPYLVPMRVYTFPSTPTAAGGFAIVLLCQADLWRAMLYSKSTA